jgi:hypothetical protein
VLLQVLDDNVDHPDKGNVAWRTIAGLDYSFADQDVMEIGNATDEAETAAGLVTGRPFLVPGLEAVVEKQ